MAELETIKIPELTPTSSANAEDQLILRQGVSDVRISVAALQSSIITGATQVTPGIVSLNNTVTSNSTTQAATANTVRIAYNRGTEALNLASTVNNALPGKANSVHTHDALQIVSGTIPTARLPRATSGTYGITQIDPSMDGAWANNHSAAGRVPSVERVNFIQQQLNQINQNVENLIGGVAFMPLPIDNEGETFATDFPIGTYLLASAGANVGVRGSRLYVSPVPINATEFTNSYIGQFSTGGFPEAHNLLGKWLHRGAVGPMINPINKAIRGVVRGASVDADYVSTVNVAILCQRVA